MREVSHTNGRYEDYDDDNTRVIGRTPRGRSITRVYPGYWSSSTTQSGDMVGIRNFNRVRAINHPINIEAHDSDTEKPLHNIMKKNVYGNATGKVPDPPTCGREPNNGVERAPDRHEEDSYGSGVTRADDPGEDVRAYDATIESASGCPASNNVHEPSLNRSIELPFRALLREQEDRKQQADFTFPYNLDEASQRIATRSSPAALSGANNQPLGSTVRKRGAPAFFQVSRPSKLRRIDSTAVEDVTTAPSGVLIDFTLPEDDFPVSPHPPVLKDITSTHNMEHTVTTRAESKGGTITNSTLNAPQSNGEHSYTTSTVTAASRRRQRRHNAAAAKSAAKAAVCVELLNQNVSQAEAARQKTFKKVLNRLCESRNHLGQDREALSARWEADAKMKEPEMMEHMQELGDYMKQIDEALVRAIAVVRRIS